MWVIKLGGSLLGSPELEHWLDIVSRHGDGKVVIVPGGGVFADAVREAQHRSGINDHVAHNLAVLAMDQYGVLMAGLNRKLATAASELEIAERGWQHRGIVWLPSKMVCADEDIPASWDVTSDTLAAWLAQTLNAEHLILVKTARPDPARVSYEALAKDGVVDQRFADFASSRSFSSWVLGKQDYVLFEEGMSKERLMQHCPPVVSSRTSEVHDEARYRAHL
ncbi:MAG TPA: uridylate kinase [Methylophilaceae bacterium]|nr:uridylate kinase [Methylophilaceae bacterium]